MLKCRGGELIPRPHFAFFCYDLPMPRVKIITELNDGIYFLTMTVKKWYYLFDRHDRRRILADAILHAQENRGLSLYAYVFMLNHIHLVIASSDAVGFVRDFKRHTASRLKVNIGQFEPNLLPLFMDSDGAYRFWKDGNAPKKIESERFLRQKIQYIESNPVKKEYVSRPEHWLWSSACPESPLKVTREW